jgi:alanine dehydrogenase
MIIGVPKEIKTNENRVALVPAGAEALAADGHTVLVEQGAGEGSGFADDAYRAAGATLVPNVADVWARAEMILKVKEPIKPEWPRIRKGQVLFTYFHFAADEELTRAHVQSGCVAIAYETVQLPSGELPLLTPMSEVAGRMAVQEGAKYLEKLMGGKGILLGGVPGVRRATVCIIGGGVVGANAARIAIGLGAQVTVLDVNLKTLAYLDDIYEGRIITQYSDPHAVEQAVVEADLVIGAVLIAGARAPRLVTEEMIKHMEPGSVIVDVSIDQGGCVATARPTTHDNPTYVVHDVIHYMVANMPGAVPRTSTFALTNATIPYVLRLANNGLEGAIAKDPVFISGLNTYKGTVPHPAVAEALGVRHSPYKAA